MPSVGSEGKKVGDAPYRPDGRRRRKFVLVSNLLNIPEIPCPASVPVCLRSPRSSRQATAGLGPQWKSLPLGRV